MTRTRRIGILTGGGDVPGLNSVIKSVVYRSTELGYDVVGIRRGWEGLTHMRPGPELDPDYLRRLDRINTRTIDRTGGTWLHTSRTNPRKMRGKTLPPWLPAADAARYASGEDLYDLTAARARAHRGPRPRLPRGDRGRRHAELRRGPLGPRASRSSPSPRRWTTTSRAPSTASASRRRSPGPRSSSTGSGRRSARTSGSASSGSSVAMPGSRRCSPPTSPPRAASSRRPASTWTGWPRSWPRTIATTRATTRSSSPPRVRIWEGGSLAEYGEADAYGHRHKVNVGEALADGDPAADRHRDGRLAS